MDSDQFTKPAITTWLMAALPILCLLAYYYPVAEAPTGLVIIAGGGVAMYRVARWAARSAVSLVRSRG